MYIVLNKVFNQVSGTAAKLGRPNAYHHCTLLVNVNKVDLSQALQKPEVKHSYLFHINKL